jgi:hypothetical protein
MAESFYEKSNAYKIALWIMGFTIASSVITVFISIMMYFDAARKLKKQQQIGQRIEQQCGKEGTEMETERYYIYREYEERGLYKQINSALVIVRVMLGLIIFAVTVAYGLWTYMILYGRDGIITPFKFSTNPTTKTQRFGVWLLYAVIASSLLTGTAGSWIRAADADNYHKTNGKITKTGFIASPWFPIVLVVSYGVFWAWLTSRNADVGSRVQKSGAVLWFVLLVLYFFVAALVWVAEKDTRNLTAAIIGSYEERKKALLEKIQTLVKTNDTEVFKYFKSWIETVRPNTEVAEYQLQSNGNYYDHLWKYIQHRSGKEMEELYNQAREAAITDIRTEALKMRMTSGPMRKATQRFCRNAIVAPVILFVIVSFMAFNWLTRVVSPTTVVIASLLLTFAVIILSTGFGWVSNALLL